MRCLSAFSILLLCCLPSSAAKEKILHDCQYWLLGNDESEQATLLKACDRIIKGKGFSKADRAMAYAEQARAASREERNDDAIAHLGQSLELEPGKPEAPE